MFRSFDQGDRTVCREVCVPTPEEEDAKRLDRERVQLSAERTRHVNRIRALLNLHGIREVKALWGGDWRKWLQVVRTADDEPLGKFLAAELTMEFERLGSGLIAHNQKITVAARAMAERKAIGHLS